MLQVRFVFSACVEGTYGEDCKKNCSQMCNTTCTPDYGHCECKAGYTGATCFDQGMIVIVIFITYKFQLFAEPNL